MGAEAGPDPARDAVLYANEFRTDTIISDGPDAGRRCALLRLAGCNLTCSGCAQPTTWGPYALSRPVRVGVFLDRLDQAGRTFPIGRVIIAGGEPLLQQEGPGLRCLVESCVNVGRTVHIHTNGTMVPAPWLKALDEAGVVRWRVAPKIFGAFASDPKPRRVYAPALRWFVRSQRTEFVFRCDDPVDIDAVRLFCTDYQLHPGRVWVDSSLQRVRVIATAAVRAGFNATTDLCVIMMDR
jgi:7-carboxy-7-deazaguanine synthase